MYSFQNDYSEGCCPEVLAALTATNLDQTVGYGRDQHCAAAAELIRRAIDCPGADIHFLVGGTQTNQTAIAAFLRPHEAAIAVSTGHINVHETGAIEATGHKVLSLPAEDGKLTPAMIAALVEAHPDEHMVRPRLVYLSDSTELGTIYTKGELEAISAYCKTNDLYLYLDGARLGCALTAPGNDLTLPDLARLCDAFYIGGTKNGALFGEALVIVNDALKPDFRYFIKQRGGMLAKGRLLGLQFEVLFQDDLYFRLADHANRMAQRLRQGMENLGYVMSVSSPTNQLFPLLPNGMRKELDRLCRYEVISRPAPDHTVIRLVTSWATPEEAVDGFLKELALLS